MATYAFEIMSQEQAAALTATDRLVILDPAAGASSVSVAFSASSVTIGYGGRTLAFGSAFSSQTHSIRPSGEPGILVGSTGDDALTGFDQPSGPIGAPPTGDILYGGPGSDTINSGNGEDTVSGGSGADLFVFNALQTGIGEVVTDFEAIDHISFDIVPTAQTYVELTAASMSAANTLATNELRADRADVVAVQVGTTVYLYADSTGRNLFGNVVTLNNTTLAQLDLSTFVLQTTGRFPAPLAPGFVDAPVPAPPSTPAPTAPDAPALVGTPRGVATVNGNMDDIHFGQLRDAEVRVRTDADLNLAGGGATLRLHGSVLVYDVHQELIEGVAHSINYASTGIVPLSFDLTVNGIGQRLTAFVHWIEADASQEALATFLQAGDSLAGGPAADLLRGYDGGDLISGGGGRDTLYGGLGDDVIYARRPPGTAPAEGAGDTYLRGDEGNDWIAGGSGFDDINGNMGADTASGGGGADWVVGGKDHDLLFGDAGDDLVYGNLGNDTCDGGEGADVVRGGQGEDVVRGFSGNDYMSGDRGSDTVTGGEGADIFHTFADAGVDLVTDFVYGEGDRVQVDPGTVYTVAQVGRDVVISMDGGGQMVLQNVLLSTLGPGWIYGP